MTVPRKFGDSLSLIHEQAIRLTGLDDFGPADYLPGLRVLLRSVDSDLRPTPVGRDLVWATLLNALAARAYVIKGWKEYPRALEESIAKPLVITGMPRTGTTALHKLLAVDAQFQGIEYWLALSPMPRPPRDQWPDTPGYQRCADLLNGMFAEVPELRAAHNMLIGEVDECLNLLSQGFVSNRWACTWKAPSYDAWWQTRSERSSYRWYADALRLIGHGQSCKRWLLKNPGHICTLDLLFEVFPDACVVHTHRDPVRALASFSSIVSYSDRIYEGDLGNEWCTSIGPREMEKWATGLSSAMPVRETHRGRVFDLDHRRFVREPMRIVQEIYDCFGMTLTEETEKRMRARTAESPERKYGEHRYNLESFGLIKEEIEERYADYIEEFDLRD